LAARVQQRVVVEAGVAAGRLRLRVLVENHRGLVLVAQFGHVGVLAMHAQAERSLVPGDGAIEVADGEVDFAESEVVRELAHGCPRNQYDARGWPLWTSASSRSTTCPRPGRRCGSPSGRAGRRPTGGWTSSRAACAGVCSTLAGSSPRPPTATSRTGSAAGSCRPRAS